MKFITNLFKNKMIFYLAFVLLVISISYNLFNTYTLTMCKGITYKEGITQNNVSSCNIMNKMECLSNAGYCDWNSKLYQCSNKHNCYDINNKPSCNQQKYCSWNNYMNTCNIK